MFKIITNYLFFLYFFQKLIPKENKIIVKVSDKIVSSYEIENKINTELILET